MGKKRVEDILSKIEVPEKNKSFSALFEKECPRYMAMGMTYTQFWEDSDHVNLPIYFRKKREYELNNENLKAYLNGIYFMKAIGVVLSESNPDYDLETLNLSINKEEIEAKIIAQNEAVFENLMRMAHDFNRNIKSKNKESEVK